MTKTVHPVAGALAILTIATFWLSTALSELFASQATVAAVKTAIPWGFLLLVPALAAAGGLRLCPGEGAAGRAHRREDQAHADYSCKRHSGAHPLSAVPCVQGESRRVRYRLLCGAGARACGRGNEHHATRSQPARRPQDDGLASPTGRRDPSNQLRKATAMARRRPWAPER